MGAKRTSALSIGPAWQPGAPALPCRREWAKKVVVLGFVKAPMVSNVGHKDKHGLICRTTPDLSSPQFSGNGKRSMSMKRAKRSLQ